ncbi:hypothetical protein ABBQ32_012666 [Trebouxia sp. C0010 RCD-2024]
MPQALPAPVSNGFPDGPVASAMLLWAEDIDIPLDTARQAVQHVHAQHMAQGRCPFPSGKQPSRTPDEPEMCTNNDLDCTRRSVHREKSPARGGDWQCILSPAFKYGSTPQPTATTLGI